MSIDHPHSGGGPTHLDRLKALAEQISRDNVGTTYMLFEPHGDNEHTAFVSNETRLVHKESGAGHVSYYINGLRACGGFDVIIGSSK